MNSNERLAYLLLHWEELSALGQDVPAHELAKDVPELIEELARRIDILKRSAWLDQPLDDVLPDDEGPRFSTRPLPVLAGRYRLDSLIAEGGFAQVFRAFDTELQRVVAVKLPKRGRLHSAEAFLAEARRVAGLKHDNIVSIYDVGAENGLCFIVSEYVEGGSLSQRLGARQPARADSLRWVAEIADALDYAHANGIVHCDIKPGNILIDHHGHAKLADFGIAQSAAMAAETASSVGTLRYMSPERVQGRPADSRSDIYGLGVVLVELLTGRVPYSCTTLVGLRNEIANGCVELPRYGLPKPLSRLCRQALSADAAARPATAHEFATHLRVLGQRSVARVAWPWVAWSLVALLAAAVLWPEARRWAAVLTSPPGQIPGQLLVSGIGRQRHLEGRVPAAWIKDGVFAEIKGAEVATFPRLPVSQFVLELDVEMRNPQGRISFFTGEAGSGTDLAFGGLWPQDRNQDRVPCRLFRAQPWGVNWRGEAHLPAHERLAFKVIVNDDFKALVRNGRVVLAASGDASDFCLTITTTDETDATIHRATLRALTQADADEANQELFPHVLESDAQRSRPGPVAPLEPGWKTSPNIGESFVLPVARLPMHWIEPTAFVMGTSEETLPQFGGGTESVRISRGYWIGRYEVTQALWEAVMGTRPSRITGSPELPVNNVAWSDACAFCRRLTQRETRAGRCPEGYEYRLPTEAEWECACRAGTDEAFVVPLHELAVRDQRHGHIVEVGTTPPNPWGLHEMLGNVPEWCLDSWRDYTGNDAAPIVDRLHEGNPRRSAFVVRGGGVWITETRPTSFARTRRHDIAGGFRGFRVVLGPRADAR